MLVLNDFLVSLPQLVLLLCPGLGVPGAEAAEFLYHSSLAALKVSDFVGREDLLQRALEDNQMRTTSPDSSARADCFGCWRV